MLPVKIGIHHVPPAFQLVAGLILLGKQ